MLMEHTLHTLKALRLPGMATRLRGAAGAVRRCAEPVVR